MSLASSPQDTQASATIFVGRKREQRMYERLLSTKETHWVMLIAGLPGSGKSTLLRQLARQNKARHIPVALVDFTQPWLRSDILTILEKLAEQIQDNCIALQYQKFRESLQSSRKQLTEIGRVINQILIAKEHANVKDVQMLIEVADAYKEKALQINAQALRDFYDLIDTFQPNQLVIMFDASEWLNKPGSEEIGQWVMDEFIPGLHTHMRHEPGRESHREPQQCSFVISSRDRLDLKAIPDDEIIQCDMLPLEQTEVDTYLNNLGMKDSTYCRQIYNITHGHPLCVSLIGELWLKGVAQALTMPELPEERKVLSEGELLQFLANRILDKRLELPFDDVTRYGALLRSFTLPMLLEIFPGFFVPGKEHAQFAQLTRSSYIIPKGNHYAFHDLLREVLATYVRETEPEKWKDYHKKALDYLTRLNQASSSPRRADWSAYPLDWYYHELAYDEESGLADWVKAIEKASSAGVRELQGALLLVAQDKTLALSAMTRATVAYQQGHYYAANQQWDEALKSYMQSLDLYIDAHDSPGRAKACTAIAEAYRFRAARDLKQALSYYQQAHSIYHQLKDPEQQAHTLYALGSVQYLNGELTAALEYYEKSLTLYDSQGLNQQQAKVHRSIGDVLRDRKNSHAAMEHYQQALAVFPGMSKRDQASIYTTMAEIEQGRHNLKAASQNYQKALDIYIASGDDQSQISIDTAMGDIKRSLGELDSALESYRKAIELSQGQRNYWHQAYLHEAIGDIERDRHDWDAAMEDYQKALTLAVGDGKRIAYLTQRIGDVLGSRGRSEDIETMLEDYRQALEDYRGEGDDAGMAYVYQVIAQMERSRRDPNLKIALEQYGEALKHYVIAGDNAGAAYVCKVMGDIEQFLHNWIAAPDHYNQALDFYLYALPGGREDKAGRAYVYKVMGELEQSKAGQSSHAEDARMKYGYAMECYAKALILYHENEDPMGEAYVYRVIGDVQRTLKEWDAALENYELALRHYRKAGNFAGQAETDMLIGSLQEALKHREEAMDSYQEAAALYRIQDNPEGKVKAQQALDTLLQSLPR